MSDKRWRAIPDYDQYMVSDQGEIYSRPRPGTAGGYLVWQLNSAGYPTVRLSKDGRAKTWQVHKLVMRAFVGVAPVGQEIRHLNGDPADCRLDNLTFGTHAENGQDMVQHGSARRAQLERWRRWREQNGEETRHGLESTYVNHGCRCADCTRASNKNRRNRERKHAKGRLQDAN